MCRVFMVAGIKPSTQAKAWKFAEAIAKPMSRGNSDGLGYSAVTADGKMFGERWLNNDEAFKPRIDEAKDLDAALFENFAEVIDGDKKKRASQGEYNSHGEVQKNKAVAITLHTRYATSPKGMQNTHPFVDAGVSLIHNGVIRNADKIGLKISTCDSEAILRQYIDRDVVSNPENFQEVANSLEGYYACGVLTKAEKSVILDIFRAHGANLHTAYVEELETWVISTSDDDIKSACKELGFSMGEVYKIKEGKFIRVNAVSGKVMSTTPFELGKQYSTFGTPSTTTTNTQRTGSYGSNYRSGVYDATKPGMPEVYPFGPRRGREFSQPLMDYLKTTPVELTKLTDQEAQEIIMQHTKLLGTMY